MATPDFHYQDPFPIEKDDTQYRLITSDYVSVGDFEGHPMLKVEPEGLRLLAAEAFHDVAFFLRPAHLKQVAAILDDPEASANDKSVALTMLRNAEVASAGILPFCQDTGTATIVGKKGQQVWTGCDDCEQLSHGVYDAYTQNNLRYSQTVALDMYTEKNTGTNLPAQIDIEAVEGMKYSFLFVAKGGGSANKTYLYQETKALLNPATLKKFLVEKMSTTPAGILGVEGGKIAVGARAALPHRLRHRRHIRGKVPENREDGFHQVLRQPSDHGQRVRTRLPRPGAGKGTA